jgi:tyrosyl-DNA phosphodiesterase 2
MGPSEVLRRLATPLRRTTVPVGGFNAATGQWTNSVTADGVERDEVTLTTFNIWNEGKQAERRYQAIAELLSARGPDIMVFQEITRSALRVFLAQRWIRDSYVRAAVSGFRVGNYGMLMLSRLPVTDVTYTRLPTRQARGYLRADLMINGIRQPVCSVHLDSGKSSKPLRTRQLETMFRALQNTEDAVLLGDFNMRDDENEHIDPLYTDLWPALRPGEDGFTEDTSINLMRYDMKDKHRHVRFDRVLLKGDHWTAAEIELLGTKPIGDDPRVFPSDHFGVECRLRRRIP